MPITVTKISEALYTATATPPHVQNAWSTTEPLRANQLWQELLVRGGHQIDVGDAFDEADWNWLNRNR